MTPPRRQKLRYQPAFDGMRCLGVLSVMCAHAAVYQPLLRYPASNMPVDMFFVISGYLITTLLLREQDSTGRVSLRAFYVRRVARLYPVIVGIVTVMILSRIFAPDAPSTPGWLFIAGTTFYFANFAALIHPAEGTNAWISLWSLSIEEQFYAIWPGVLLVTLGRSRRLIRPLVLVVTGTVAMWAWRSWGMHRALTAHPDDPALHFRSVVDLWHRFDFSTFYRPDGLLIGCALGILLARPDHPITRALIGFAHRARLLVIAVIVAIVVRTVRGEPWQVYWGLSVFNIGIALVLTEILTSPDSWIARILGLRPLVWVGRRSYFIYAVHLAVFAFAFDVLGLTSLPGMAATTAVIFALSAVSYRYYENPVRKWGQRVSSRIIARDGTVASPSTPTPAPPDRPGDSGP